MLQCSVRRLIYAVILAVVVGSAGVRIGAQQPQASQEAPPPTIRVSTRLVLVDVLVTDKNDKPVAGLKAEDFTVQEKGKAQKIAFFTPAGEREQQRAAVQLPPGIYSNKPEYRSPGGL